MGDNLISSAIPNLINGVSQQPAVSRLSSQCDLQENAYATVVNGLEKRPPTQHITRISDRDVGKALVHTINRSPTERYTVLLENGDLSVYGMDGTNKSISFPDGKGYLHTSADPVKSLKALTIADYTFVVNTEKPVAMATSTTVDTKNKSLVFVKQGQYSTSYMIRIDGSVTAHYLTSGSSVDDIQTDNIAKGLAASFGLAHKVKVADAAWNNSTYTLTQTGAFTNYTWKAGDRIQITNIGSVTFANLLTGRIPGGDYVITSKVSNDAITLDRSIFDGSSTGGGWNFSSGGSQTGGPLLSSVDGPDFTTNAYSVTQKGSTIYIVKNDGTAIDIDVQDSFGNRCLSVATNVVKEITDLPLVAPDGFTTKVTGNNTSPDDDYYVRFSTQVAGQTFGNGSWVETAGPNVHSSLDSTTMPFVLVRNVDGTFTFKKAAWLGRLVGDETSARNPSFVGNAIQDVFLFENRLGFISKDNVIMSEAGKFFNFFPTTVTTLLDSDPIDVSATANPANGVATLKSAVPFQSKLMLFSDHAQFALGGGADILTPKTVAIHQTTEFLSSLDSCRPIISGRNVFFPFKRGSYAGVQEYFIDLVSSNYDAAETTKHVPRYIPGAILKLTSAPNEDFIVALADGDQSSLYVYKYYWNNNQKLQSCWSRWTFDGSTIINVDFIDSVLYLTIQRPDGVYLESLSIDVGAIDPGATYVARLDRRVTNAACTVSYNASTGRTTFTLPYQTTGPMQAVARQGASVVGHVFPLTALGTTQMTAAGDLTATPVYLGNVYTETYRFSPAQLHEQQQGGASGIISAGRVQLRNWAVLYDQSGYFRIEVTPQGRDKGTYVFSARHLGATLDPLGSVLLRSGRFSCPIYSRADRVQIDLINDSPLPSRILSAEFEALYVIRSTRF